VKYSYFCYLGPHTKFRNPRKTFEIPPNCAPKYSAGGRGGPRNFLFDWNHNIFVRPLQNFGTLRQPLLREKQTKIVAYLSCSAGRTHFARTNTRSWLSGRWPSCSWMWWWSEPRKKPRRSDRMLCRDLVEWITTRQLATDKKYQFRGDTTRERFEPRRMRHEQGLMKIGIIM
jgi:hypothetical protein